jgi:peptide/nickel transport system permease protein
MFIIGQLGIINIYISHEIRPMDDPLSFELHNVTNAWPQFMENIIKDLYTAPWIPLSACVAITISVVGFFMLGEGLKKYFKKTGDYI